MPWFKTDDGFYSHPKVLSIPRTHRTAAIGLWALAGAWCSRHLTDGRFPAYMVEELSATTEDAEHLVSSGLWHSTEDGYRFHEWEHHQPVREKVEAERAAARERVARAREAKRSQSVRPNTSVTPPNVRTNTVSTGRNVRSTPTRPDPTRPTSTDVDVSVDVDKPTRTNNKGHRLPDDWQPNAKHLAIATERGVNPGDELDKFRDWAAANGAVKKDWDATFRNWLRNARPSAPASPAKSPTGWLAIANKLHQEEQ